jgi:hypothetical protein
MMTMMCVDVQDVYEAKKNKKCYWGKASAHCIGLWY